MVPVPKIIPQRNSWDIYVVVKAPSDLEHHRQSYALLRENMRPKLLLSSCRFFDHKNAYNEIEHDLVL